MLPIEPIKASRINPRLLVIYGKSKCGKTTAASMLPNSLILDFEDGSDFVSALKVKILGLNSPGNESPESRQKRQDSGRYFINEVLLEIREFRRKNNRYPYERVIIDTSTRFEELCEDVATLDYMNSPQGSKFNRDQTGNILPKSQWESALTLPMGLGYGYLRQAFNRWLAVIKEMAPDVIMICHVKDKFVNKSGKEMTANDLNLTGRVAQILAAQSDAIGYVYRKKNQTFINFASADDTCGARCNHLKGKELLLMEELPSGELKHNWDSIYLPSEQLNMTAASGE